MDLVVETHLREQRLADLAREIEFSAPESRRRFDVVERLFLAIDVLRGREIEALKRLLGSAARRAGSALRGVRCGGP